MSETLGVIVGLSMGAGEANRWEGEGMPPMGLPGPGLIPGFMA